MVTPEVGTLRRPFEAPLDPAAIGRHAPRDALGGFAHDTGPRFTVIVYSYDMQGASISMSTGRNKWPLKLSPPSASTQPKRHWSASATCARQAARSSTTPARTPGAPARPPETRPLPPAELHPENQEPNHTRAPRPAASPASQLPKAVRTRRPTTRGFHRTCLPHFGARWGRGGLVADVFVAGVGGPRCQPRRMASPGSGLRARPAR